MQAPTENSTNQTPKEFAFLRGTISRFTYRNPENGFSVVRIEPEQDLVELTGDKVTLVGVLPATINTGSTIIARGKWKVHPKFGKQFDAKSITESVPTGAQAIEKYLASGAIKGFGPVLAKRVVEAFGDKALKILDEDPDRLQEISGVGSKKLVELKEAWAKKANQREVYLFFQKYDISPSLAERLFKVYGLKTIEIVSANPYILVKEVWGIGFHTADKIALSLGIEPNAHQRVVAALSYSVLSGSNDGHTFLPKEKLLELTCRLIGVEDVELLTQCLSQALLEGELIEVENSIYLPSLYKAETDLATNLSSRLHSSSSPEREITTSTLDDTLVNSFDIQTATGLKVIHLSEEQKRAVHLASDKLITLITGGPGCGKTTVVKAISSLFKRAGLEFALAAPTGRAAQRLGEVCSMEASTIHRLLKYDPMSKSFVHNQNNQLEVDALILDECSMVDIQLADSVFKALPPRARVVLVGDADQLPSVGPGLVFSDLLNLEASPKIILTQLFRRDDESSINEVAHAINHAEVPTIPEPDGVTNSDSYFLKASNPEEASQLIEKLVSEQIPKRFGKELGLSSSDIMVLSPMNKGELGISNLNKKLQEKLIPEEEKKRRVLCGHLEFHMGDRVVQRVNNYNLDANGVFNGDQGTVIGIDPTEGEMTVKLWDGREIVYSSDIMYQLDLAYALTIHRSQGSEVPVIVLAMHDSHNIMLERQLFYTAVTRAKKLLIIVGTRRAIAIATKRVRSKKRFSNLQTFISEKLNTLL